MTCVDTASCTAPTHLLIDSDKICLAGQSCDATCFNCSGPDPNQCLTCKEGFVLDGGLCVPCDASCGSCNGLTENDCTSCKYKSFLTEVPATSGNWKCHSCDESCGQGCNGPLASDCWDCKQEGFYDTGSSCAACHNTCVTCSGPNSNNCLSCLYGWFQNGTTCEFKSCTNAVEYLDPVIFDCKVCLASNPNCVHCIGPDVDDCMTCPVTKPLLRVQRNFPAPVGDVGVCSTTCQPNSYQSGSKCLSCDFSCSGCTGPLNT